jgi:hypothetical protein
VIHRSITFVEFQVFRAEGATGLSGLLSPHREPICAGIRLAYLFIVENLSCPFTVPQGWQERGSHWEYRRL